MFSMLALKSLSGLLTPKNIKIIVIGGGAIAGAFILRKKWAKWSILWNIKKYENGESEKIDYHYIATLLKDKLNQGLFGWFEDESDIIAVINALPSKTDFDLVVLDYAVSYGSDLHAELIKKISNDRKYGTLKYK